MSRHYGLLDLSSLFHRAKNVVQAPTPEMAGGMAMSVILTSLQFTARMLQAQHLVVCCDTSSWRKHVYKKYKSNRNVDPSTLKPEEIERDRIMFEKLRILQEFFRDQTNVTFLKGDLLEADDMIALWIQSHPNDFHTIISNDSDFYQLICPNVQQYNGVSQHLIKTNGEVVELRTSKPAKTKSGKLIENIEPEWALFQKCLLGDSSDSIFRAAKPRTRGTVIRKVFESRHTKGQVWDNFFLEEWADHENKVRTVKDRYEENKMLIDLSMQPEDIRDLGMTYIQEAIDNFSSKPLVGMNMMKFFNDHNLERMKKNSDVLAKILSATYR